MRLALGASRGSLVRRLLTETTLPGLAAGGVWTGLEAAPPGVGSQAEL